MCTCASYADHADMLRVMAANSGWIERGGRVVRNLEGDAVGRTHWIGQPEWARGFGMNQPEIVSTVEKAIAGQRLGKLQALLLEAMLEELHAIEKTGRPEGQPARPDGPGKARQHFPAPDRRRRTAVIYAMPKRQPNAKPKGPKGRPPIPGRRVVIKLEERHIKRAAELGNGNVAAGIRSALG